MAKQKSKIIKYRPAGKNDTFTIVGTHINNTVEKEKFVMKASEKGVRMEVLSTELTENMVIKAENNENVINFTDRKSKMEAKKKVVDFESKKAEKDQDGRDAI